MKASRERYLESLYSDFSEWDEIVGFYFERDPGCSLDEYPDDFELAVQQMHLLIERVLRAFIGYGNLRDNWNFSSRLDLLIHGQQRSVLSEKMEVQFCFGVLQDEFFLESSLSYPEYLKKMDDDFWSHVIALNALGRLEFVENVVPVSSAARKGMKALKNNRSCVFQLLRNYILS